MTFIEIVHQILLLKNCGGDVRTHAKISTPKTVKENLVTKNSETTELKQQRIKITKKVIKDRLFAAYVVDAELRLKDFSKSELDTMTGVNILQKSKRHVPINIVIIIIIL